MSLCNGAASVVCPSVCELLRKSLLLPRKRSDRYQTCTRWTPSQRASRMCSKSRSRSNVTWYAHFLGFLEWATPSLTVWFSYYSRPFRPMPVRKAVMKCFCLIVTTWSLNAYSRAVFGGIRWHFKTMLSRTVCLIYMDSLSRSYDVAEDAVSSQVPVSWPNVHRMVPNGPAFEVCSRSMSKSKVWRHGRQFCT